MLPKAVKLDWVYGYRDIGLSEYIEYIHISNIHTYIKYIKCINTYIKHINKYVKHSNTYHISIYK